MLSALLFQSLAELLGGAVAWLVTRLLRASCSPWPFQEPRTAGVIGLVATGFGWMLISTLLLAFAARGAYPRTEPVPTAPSETEELVLQAIIALLLVLPALVALREQQDPLASAGVSTRNFKSALVVGLLLSTGIVLFSPRGNMLSPEMGEQAWLTLVRFGIVGLAEEFLFRGFLQTRLIAWLGQWRGWVLASLLMALAHVTQRMTLGGLTPPDALVSSLTLLPFSLLLGYVMLRTDNIVAPALLHAFANWSDFLS